MYVCMYVCNSMYVCISMYGCNACIDVSWMDGHNI